MKIKLSNFGEICHNLHIILLSILLESLSQFKPCTAIHVHVHDVVHGIRFFNVCTCTLYICTCMYQSPYAPTYTCTRTCTNTCTL